uniref:Uncharacterized protein n=1 Tax=viral metagenome TaxID=1070528 RepID=A0A6M3LJ57_9ZZZZ
MPTKKEGQAIMKNLDALYLNYPDLVGTWIIRQVKKAITSICCGPKHNDRNRGKIG